MFAGCQRVYVLVREADIKQMIAQKLTKIINDRGALKAAKRGQMGVSGSFSG